MGDVRLRFTFGIVAVFLLLTAVPAARASGNLQEPILPNFTGTVYTFDGKILTLEQEDSNKLDFHCSRKTKYLDGKKKLSKAAIKPGLLVTVEGKPAPDASLDAVVVRLEHEQPKAGN